MTRVNRSMDATSGRGDRLFSSVLGALDVLTVHMGDQLGVGRLPLGRRRRLGAVRAADADRAGRGQPPALPRPARVAVAAGSACGPDRRGPVADVGSGDGWSSIGMALAYPSARVHGFDVDPASIEAARKHAAGHGGGDRVSFHLGRRCVRRGRGRLLRRRHRLRVHPRQARPGLYRMCGFAPRKSRGCHLDRAREVYRRRLSQPRQAGIGARVAPAASRRQTWADAVVDQSLAEVDAPSPRSSEQSLDRPRTSTARAHRVQHRSDCLSLDPPMRVVV